MTDVSIVVRETSDQKKSIMIARLIGLEYRHGDWCDGDGVVYEEWVFHQRGFKVESLNLYDPQNMVLAWRVLNWFAEEIPGRTGTMRIEFGDFWKSSVFWTTKPADAQRAWLDKILTLAIDAGMVKLTNN